MSYKTKYMTEVHFTRKDFLMVGELQHQDPTLEPMFIASVDIRSFSLPGDFYAKFQTLVTDIAASIIESNGGGKVEQIIPIKPDGAPH